MIDKKNATIFKNVLYMALTMSIIGIELNNEQKEKQAYANYRKTRNQQGLRL
jgi:hypothetical protein